MRPGLGLLALALAGLPLEAAAAPLILTWRAPAECPDREVVIARLEAALGRPVDDAPPIGGPFSARVGADATGGFALQITVPGEPAHRDVAPSCDALVDRLVAWLVSRAPPGGAPRTTPPPPPPPAPADGYPGPYAAGVHVGLRGQAGLTGGVLGNSGAGVGLTGIVYRANWRAEVTGRYHLPRNTAFEGGVAVADVSMFELGIRGCPTPEFGRVKLLLCAGLAGGRWTADLVANGPSLGVSDLWVGAHASLGASYPIVERAAVWVAVEGVVSLVRPEFPFPTEAMAAPTVPPLQPERFGTAIEIGIELDFS